MRHPFPGMDPWLEHPEMWMGVHNALITHIAESIAPRVRPRYLVAIEKRTYEQDWDEKDFLGQPDAVVIDPMPRDDRVSDVRKPYLPVRVRVPVPTEVREAYIEVRGTADREVVTLIEILSPTNKIPGKGRRLYERKRLKVLGNETHLIEVDLLRVGKPMKVYGATDLGDYRILVSRANNRMKAELYPFSLRDPIPIIPVPLKKGDREPDLDIGALLKEQYDRMGYDMHVDYKREPVPPLPAVDRGWAHEVLTGAKLR